MKKKKDSFDVGDTVFYNYLMYSLTHTKGKGFILNVAKAIEYYTISQESEGKCYLPINNIQITRMILTEKTFNWQY